METRRRCNICGKEMDEWDLHEDFKIHAYVGYGSKYDTSIIKLHMCCSCFDKIVDSCEISPVVGEYDIYGPVIME